MKPLVDNEQQMIEIDIEEAKTQIRRMEALKRLYENPDFKEVILKGYLEEESVRLVAAVANPNVDKYRNRFLEMIIAISHFRQYLQNTLTMGKDMKETMEEMYETKDEIERGE